jgi:hypothetical protein
MVRRRNRFVAGDASRTAGLKTETPDPLEGQAFIQAAERANQTVESLGTMTTV